MKRQPEPLIVTPPPSSLIRTGPPTGLEDAVEFVSQRRVETAQVALRIVPTARVELIFTFGDPFQTGEAADQVQPLARAAVLAARRKPYWQVAGPRIDWFLVALTPWGCRRLLGRPQADLWERDRALSDLIGASTAEDLHAALAGEPDYQARVALFERFAATRIAAGLGDAEVAEAARLARTPDARTVGRLCEILGVGPRRLRQRFAAEVGCAPKTWLSIVRFGRHLASVHPAPWLKEEPSYDDAFTDQSHLTRAFHRYAGTTPGQYREAKALARDPLVFTSRTIDLTRRNTC